MIAGVALCVPKVSYCFYQTASFLVQIQDFFFMQTYISTCALLKNPHQPTCWFRHATLFLHNHFYTFYWPFDSNKQRLIANSKLLQKRSQHTSTSPMVCELNIQNCNFIFILSCSAVAPLGWNGGLKTLMRFATLLVSLPASTLCRLRWVILLRLCFRIVQSEEGGEHKNSWSSRGWIVPFFFRCFNSLHQLVHLSCSWSATVVLVSDPALVVVPASSLFVSSMKNARDAERVYDPKQERPETRSYTWHSLLDSMIRHVSCRMSVFRKVKYFWIFKWFEEMGEKIQVLQRDEDEGLTSACV